jgi:hypothetical protein
MVTEAWSRRGVLIAALPLAPDSGHHEVQIAVSRADGAAWKDFKIDGGGDYDFPVWFGAGERTAAFEAAPRRVQLGRNNQSFGWAPNTYVWRMDNFPITWGGDGSNEFATYHLVTLHLYRLNSDPRLFDAVLDQHVQQSREASFLGESGSVFPEISLAWVLPVIYVYFVFLLCGNPGRKATFDAKPLHFMVACNDENYRFAIRSYQNHPYKDPKQSFLPQPPKPKQNDSESSAADAGT